MPFSRRWWSPDSLAGAVALYLTLGGFACLWRLGAVGLVHMEGMLVDGARRMLASGDWLVPRVYGELYTFKPALGYWLAATAVAASDPPPAWLMRLPFAAGGVLMGLAVLLLVARVAGPRTGLVAALASVTGALFVQHVRVAEFDLPLAAGVGVAVAAACTELAAERPRAWRWVLAYGGLTVGFLAKGLPALMCFGPGLLAAAAACGRLRDLFRWRHLTAVALFLLATGGYLAGVYRAGGSEAFEQPLLEGKVRGLSWATRQHSHVLSATVDPTGAAAEETSARPIDAALKSLAKPLHVFISFLPWALLLPFAFVRRATARDAAGGPGLELLLRSARWFLVAGVVVFMLVPTYETRYFLPLAVPVGILCGVVATRRGTGARRLLTAAGVGAILSALAMLVFGVGADTPPVPMANRVTLALGGALLLAIAGWWLRGAQADRALALLVLAALGWTAAESLSAQPRRAAAGRDLRSEAARLGAELPAGATVWVLGPADLAGKHASLYFYLDRPVATFAPPAEPPPAGSYCLLTANRLPPPGSMEFAEVARVASPRYTYLLGRCGPPR